MKILRALLLALLPAAAFAQPGPPYLTDYVAISRQAGGFNFFPAYTVQQLQVFMFNNMTASPQTAQAGLDNTQFITAYTLAQVLGGGGGGLGSMAHQNANAVAITGGTTNGLFGTANTEGSLTLNGITTVNNSFAYSPAPMSALAIDTTQPLNTKTVSVDSSFTLLSGATTPGQAYGAQITNGDAAARHTMTLSGFTPISLNTGSTRSSFKIGAGGVAKPSFYWDGSNTYMSGDPVFADDLPTKSSLVGADLIHISDSASSPTVFAEKTITWTNLLAGVKIPKYITLQFNGNGGALTTGAKSGTYYKAPLGGTLAGWYITAYPSGSVTIDVWRAANGAGYPTTSIIGSGNKPLTSSAVENSATTLTSWTSTTVTAADNFLGDIAATDGTVQYATAVLVYY